MYSFKHFKVLRQQGKERKKIEITVKIQSDVRRKGILSQIPTERLLATFFLTLNPHEPIGSSEALCTLSFKKILNAYVEDKVMKNCM